MTALVRRAVEIADDVLFPAALAVDRADRVPAGHFDRLAGAGLYGLFAPPAVDFPTVAAVTAALAGGCLATAFVWIQHHGPLIAVAERAPHWVPLLASGERTAGIAMASVRGPAPVRVRPVADGYRLDGSVDWVTGWGLVDVVQVAALDENDVVHYLLVDLTPGPTMSADLVDVVTTRASRTATVTFTGHPVPADRLLRTVPLDEWTRSEAAGSTLNGFLSIGVAARCCRLLGPTPLDDEVDRCREALLTADGPDARQSPPSATDLPLPAARAAASELVLRASAALVVHTGSRAVRLDNHAQRIAREAIFLQTFGSRPSIRAALLTRLTRVSPA
ncbi:acyl-CoA dehydrogenase family protein [Virgisporangium aurantiacum]|uniref:acyl-CoA dehydrogenase family protein n=1 Tax=Virgisporangium aurantiacum TaxID=175570 RepID=UPI001EF2BF4D|nr:acyl-CoA dehydrogenase family protein [Virgisporangium aurantiacum]